MGSTSPVTPRIFNDEPRARRTTDVERHPGQPNPPAQTRQEQQPDQEPQPDQCRGQQRQIATVFRIWLLSLRRFGVPDPDQRDAAATATRAATGQANSLTRTPRDRAESGFAAFADHRSSLRRRSNHEPDAKPRPTAAAGNPSLKRGSRSRRTAFSRYPERRRPPRDTRRRGSCRGARSPDGPGSR